MASFVIETHSKEETMELGSKIIDVLPNGHTITLTGDLGAGKTTFVRGVAIGLGIKEVVQSPTFNIMKIYLKGKKPLIHIDAYRLADIDTDIGLDEYIGYESGLTVIEWPNYIEKLIPNSKIELTINNLGGDDRRLTFKCEDQTLLEGIKQCLLSC